MCVCGLIQACIPLYTSLVFVWIPVCWRLFLFLSLSVRVSLYILLSIRPSVLLSPCICDANVGLYETELKQPQHPPPAPPILLLLLPSSSDRSAINQRSFHCPTEIGATVRSSHPCLYNNPAISMHAGVPCPVRVISVALYHYQYWFPGLAWIITWSCQGASIRAFIIWILYSCCIACTYVLNIDRVPI